MGYDGFSCFFLVFFPDRRKTGGGVHGFLAGLGGIGHGEDIIFGGTSLVIDTETGNIFGRKCNAVSGQV